MIYRSLSWNIRKKEAPWMLPCKMRYSMWCDVMPAFLLFLFKNENVVSRNFERGVPILFSSWNDIHLHNPKGRFQNNLVPSPGYAPDTVSYRRHTFRISYVWKSNRARPQRASLAWNNFLSLLKSLRKSLDWTLKQLWQPFFSRAPCVAEQLVKDSVNNCSQQSLDECCLGISSH